MVRPKKVLFQIIIISILSLSVFAAETEEWPHAHGMNTAELEDFLATAKVMSMKRTKLGITKPYKIILEKNNVQIKALFKTFSSLEKFSAGRSRTRQINNADRFEYDITAYKFARLLGVKMIPVTVIRKIDGKKGAVVFWIESALIYKNVYANKFKEIEVCPFKKSHSIMYVFDILIYNDDRNMGNVLYTIEDCRLWMIDHSRAFRVKNRISKNLPDLRIRLSEEFAQKLNRLNYQQLEEHIGEYINKNQIRFILKRRDLILQKWKDNGKLGYLEG